MAKELSVPGQEKSLVEMPEHVRKLIDPENTSVMPEGMEFIDPYDQPLYAKIVQSLSGEPYKPPYQDGDYIVTPDNRKVISMGESFHFTPVFAFTEYICRNPVLEIPGLEFIEAKTRDPESDIAKRALSRDENVNKIRHPQSPEGKDCFQEYLKVACYVIFLHDHNEEIGNVPIIHSFMKGEAKYGEAFKRLIKARKTPALYSCRFQATTSLHTGKGSKKWFGTDIINPEDNQPYVTADELEVYRELYLQCKKAFEDEGLNVNYDQDMDTVDGSVVTDEKF